ncbi:hypothetical protein HDU85_002900 [Gaertneriomyces sp. JEL0708]|nr:hypothetical protein HDU85_002900 [Gaertneriomyces sp. JEL0708]
MNGDAAACLTSLPTEILWNIFSILLEEPDEHAEAGAKGASAASPLSAVGQCCSRLAGVTRARQWEKPTIPVRTISDENAQRKIEDNLIRNGSFIRSLSIPHGNRPTPPVDISRIAPSLSGLLHVDLSACPMFSINDSHISAIVNNCPRLSSVIVDDCIDITDLSLFSLARHPNVRHFTRISISRCCEITDAGLLALAPHLRSIQYLNVACIPALTSDALSTTISHAQTLKELVLSDLDEAVTDAVLATIAVNCLLLERLDVADCMAITPAGVVEFARLRGKPLKHINLNGTHAMTDESILALCTSVDMISPCFSTTTVEKFRPPSSLSLSLAQGITPRLFESLASWCSPNSLTSLTISLCSLPSPQTFIRFLDSQLALRFLDLADTDFVNDATCQSISKMKYLEYLDLSGHAGSVTDEGIMSIARSCPNLGDISLKNCRSLTNAAVKELASCSSKLKKVNLGGLIGVTDEAVCHLEQIFWTGQVVKLSGCFGIGDKGLMDSFSSVDPRSRTRLSTLLELCLSGCYNLTDKSLTHILPWTPRLTSINLYAAPGVTSQTLKTLGAHCGSLQTLVISKCTIEDEGIVELSRGCNGLKALFMGWIAGVGISDRGVSAVLENCKGLLCLDISASRITDACLAPESGVCGDADLQLQVLSMRCCQGITTTGVQRVVERSKGRLAKLEVGGCRGVQQGIWP